MSETAERTGGKPVGLAAVFELINSTIGWSHFL
jgi:hypothetical protein